LMSDAAALTRSGQTQKATQLIQEALHGATRPGVTRPAAADAAEFTRSPESKLILDVVARIIGEPLSPANDPDGDPLETSEYRQSATPAEARSGPQGEQWIDGSFTHKGRVLTYKLFVPALAAEQAATPLPLVVMLHGCTQTAADFAAGTQMNALARSQGVIVLYPEQAQPANAQRCWNWFKPQHQRKGSGEPAALAALTEKILAENHADPARVYVAGLSAGGAMADILGHCYPDVFAAVGVHSGLPSGAATDVTSAFGSMRNGPSASGRKANEALTVPTIVFHGDADSTVHPANGAAIVAEAAEANSRTGLDAAEARVSEGRSPRGQGFTQTAYPATSGSPDVEYWELHGAGHAWSGGSQQGTYTDPAGVDASTEMLRFFLAHKRA
jgi:poly(hydroxyalkanoate) depolymerase family esterase